MNLADILQLKFGNIDFARQQVIVRDDGHGPYIDKWDYILGPLPTQKDLDAWALEVEPQYTLQQIQEKRAQEYPPKEDLIVALWERIVEGRTDATDELQAKRLEVKQEYPKPEEI